MSNETVVSRLQGLDDTEIQEWLESLDSVLQSSGPAVAMEILERLRSHATAIGVKLPFSANTPYVNTIPAELHPGLSGRSSDRAPHQEPHPLERARDGRPRE